MATASAGIIVLGLGSSLATAAVGIVLIGVGLSLPYPLFYDEGERVLPDRPIGSLGLLQVGVNSFPIPVIPLFGAALASGDAELAFASLAAFAVLTAVLNARPPVPAAAPVRAAAGRPSVRPG